MYNCVGLDLSLASSACFIKTQDNIEYYFNYRNSNKLTKWHKVASYIQYRDYSLTEIDNFSLEQIDKLLKYDYITDLIVQDILTYCKPEETKIFSESFSYSSSVGPLIDLVTYATLLRIKLVKHKFHTIELIPPMSLKSKTCIKVYGPGEKKKPSRNKLGISGGKFTKNEMLLALFESCIQNRLKDLLSYHKDELLKMKSVPSGVSDFVDAIWLVESNI